MVYTNKISEQTFELATSESWRAKMHGPVDLGMIFVESSKIPDPKPKASGPRPKGAKQ